MSAAEHRFETSPRQEKDSSWLFLASVIVFLFAQCFPGLTDRQYLSLIVDTDGFGENEIASGGNQLIEVPHLPLACPQDGTISDGTIGYAHDVSELVDGKRPAVVSTRERSETFHPVTLRPEKCVISQRAAGVAHHPARVVDSCSEASSVAV